MQTKMKQFGPGQFSMTQRPCQHCGGTGKDMNVSPCRHCNGTGKELDYTTEYVEFPRGVDNGMAFRVEGKGNAPEVNGINGDLILHVNIVKDGYFERPDNLNVIHYETVPFAKALLGFTKEFKCVDGTTVTVNAPELTKHGQSFIFKGKGMPDVNNPSMRGDYAVVINHKLPTRLTNKQKEILKNFNQN
jgi:molecular chaperone DnaJ